MSYKFKKGDRVKVIELRNDTNMYNNIHVKNGMIGTVLESNTGRPWVEFDSYIGGDHMYQGSKKGYTMCMWEDEIEELRVGYKMAEIKIDVKPFSHMSYESYEVGLSQNVEGESKNMKILNIYEDRKIEKFNQELEEERNKIILKDPFYVISEQAKKQIKDLYKNEYGKDLSETDIELTSNLLLMSKETKEKVDNIEKNHMNNRNNLDKLLQEVKAQLELTNDYDKQIAILKNYEILDKKGQINA